MKNPLVWLFKKPETLGYIFSMAWCVFTTIEFNIEHRHIGFMYYLQLLLGCIYLGFLLYYIFTYNYRKYHKLIFLLLVNIYFIGTTLGKLFYIEHEGFGYYFRVVSIGIFVALLIFVILKNKTFLKEEED